jgi:hypothetical protein
MNSRDLPLRLWIEKTLAEAREMSARSKVKGSDDFWAEDVEALEEILLRLFPTTRR